MSGSIRDPLTTSSMGKPPSRSIRRRGRRPRERLAGESSSSGSSACHSVSHSCRSRPGSRTTLLYRRSPPPKHPTRYLDSPADEGPRRRAPAGESTRSCGSSRGATRYGSSTRRRESGDREARLLPSGAPGRGRGAPRARPRERDRSRRRGPGGAARRPASADVLRGGGVSSSGRVQARRGSRLEVVREGGHAGGGPFPRAETSTRHGRRA
jgi:hypothetical protein